MAPVGGRDDGQRIGPLLVGVVNYFPDISHGYFSWNGCDGAPEVQANGPILPVLPNMFTWSAEDPGVDG